MEVGIYIISVTFLYTDCVYVISIACSGSILIECDVFSWTAIEAIEHHVRHEE